MDNELPFDMVVDSPVGRLGLRMQGKLLSSLVFLTGRQCLIAPRDGDATRVLFSIQAYFENPEQGPDVAFQLSGTPFQRKVWQALRAIPVGKVMSYGALAERLGTSARAVGNACRNNPVPLVVPCHRVVASRGLGGFAGDSGGRLVELKRKLLAHEGVEI